MIDLISSLFKEGDSIQIEYGSSNKIVRGTILKILPSSIALKLDSGGIAGIKGDEIISFDSSDVVAPESQGQENISVIEEKEEKTEKETPDITKSIESTQSIKSAASSFKPGDVISWNELCRIDPKLRGAKKIKGSEPTVVEETAEDKTPIVTTEVTQEKPKAKPTQSKKKLSVVGNSLDSLASLVEEQHEIDNLKTVPAVGAISNVREDRNFGFIHDSKNGHDLYFSFNDVVGDLQLVLHKGVLYTEITNAEGYKAICVHKSGTVKDLLALSEEIAQKGQIATALNIIDHILDAYPDNFAADEAQKRLAKQLRTKKTYSSYISSGNPYSKAKEFTLKKDYDKAIENFLLAIKERNRTESAVKDLIVLYVQLYKSDYKSKAESWKDAALNLLEQQVGLFPDNLTTQNFLLHNCYLPLGEYEKSVEIIDEIIDNFDIQGDSNKCSTLLYTKASALIRLKKIKEAEKAIDEALLYNPQNTSALQLKELVKNVDVSNVEQLESLVSATEFESLTSGFSLFIQQTLENYDSYEGVPAKVIETGDFTDVTLREIRKLIETAGRARAKERARYILTECKLMLTIEPTEVSKLRSEMARYCNAMALNHISDSSFPDIIRYFYLEAFSLEESYSLTATQVSLYLLTHQLTFKELLNSTTTSPSVNDALAVVLSGEFDLRRWESLLSMFLYNREIFATLTSRLYEKYRNKSLEALKNWGIQTDEKLSKESFVSAWDEARKKRISDYKRIIASIKSMAEYNSIDQSVLYLSENLRKCRDEEKWLNLLDVSRITMLMNNICPAIDNFIKSSGYRNKETARNNAKGQIRQLIEEIQTGPTKVSYEAILPLLFKLDSQIDASFDKVIETSEPKLTITLLSDNTVIDDNDIVSLQVQVSTNKEASPIREISVAILDTPDVQCVEADDIQYNAIEGGGYSTFKLQIKVSNKVKNDKATAICFKCKYKNGEIFKEHEEQLSLKLYSVDDFKPIDNPYAPFADSGPVLDSKMFFGRDEFIANIVDSITKSPSKQIIIYGQKRCGKSSVLEHLKEQLFKTGKIFCASFSLGDITESLSVASFYHKILSSIKDGLDDLEFEGEIIPDIQFPNVQDFKNEDVDNPLNTFTKYMRLFKRACKTTKGWEDKNLVVMIDEFTYLYTEIKNGNISPSIMKQWKAVTQNDKAQFSVVLVGQDVVPSFKKEDYARNAFGVIQDIRLTYLQEEPARELIEKPILDENGESRYIGNAVSRIIEYTSRNPYYIQIFCARLVDYMNRNKSIKVTEADVNDVARSFVVGEQALEEDKFDNLIRPGEKKEFQEFPEEEILAVLRQIAVSSRNIGYCCIDDINILGNRKREQEIIKHLIDREVLEQKGDNNYRIQVRLFQEWLLNH